MHHSQYLLSQAFDFFFYNIFYAFFYVFLRSNGMVFSGMDYESKCPRFKTIRWLCVWLNLSSYFCIVQYLQYQCCKYKYHFWSPHSKYLQAAVHKRKSRLKNCSHINKFIVLPSGCCFVGLLSCFCQLIFNVFSKNSVSVSQFLHHSDFINKEMSTRYRYEFSSSPYNL